MLLHLGSVNFEVDGSDYEGTLFSAGKLSRTMSTTYKSFYEPNVQKFSQLIFHMEQNLKDLKIDDYVKEYRQFHMEDVQLEKFSR